MRDVNLGKALRLVVIAAVALGLGTASVFAATIESNGRVTGNWSDPSIWKGGVVPGAADNAIVAWMPAPASKITYDQAASGTVGSISGNQLVLTLARDLRVQNLYLRECTLLDGGRNATISGTLSNYLIDGYEGNGGIRTGQGGNLFISNLTLGRTGLYTFYPGDTISGKYTTNRIRNTWPDITVTQNTEFYGIRLDKGLSFENEASDAISLGRTSATDQAESTLNWDTGFNGPIDWTLRWKGDHVAALRDYHAKGQIKIGQEPASMKFNPADNIFFDAATGYTYVGFKVAQPPAPVVCNTSWGDVHIRTPDGLVYDYQGTGEFLALTSADGSIVVQARQEPFPGSSSVSVNTAVALNVNGDRVGFYAKPARSLHVNDSPLTDLLFGKMKLPQGGLIERSGDASRPQYVVRWPNGFVFCVVLNNHSFFDYGVSKPAGLQTTFDGLVGNLDGRAENDYHVRNGAVLPPPVNLPDLNRFADSWRISSTESLFRKDSAPIASAPTTALTAADLPHLAQAQQTCAAQGIIDPHLLNNCITDVGATGEKSFAESAQRVQVEQAATPAPRDPVPGTSVPVQLMSSVKYTYDAARDFSITSNPNGVWQYGWMPATGGALQLYTHKVPSPTLNRWNSEPSQEFWLSAFQNPSATPHGDPSDWVVAPGAMILHPGPQNQKSVVRFTAPVAGIYQTVVNFSLIDRQAGVAPGPVPAVDVRVVQGSTPLFSDSLRTFPDSKQFSKAIELAQGNTVDIAVGFGSTDYGNDGTRVDVQITRTCPVNTSFFVSDSCVETPANANCCACPAGTQYTSVSAGYRQCKQ